MNYVSHLKSREVYRLITLNHRVGGSSPSQPTYVVISKYRSKNWMCIKPLLIAYVSKTYISSIQSLNSFFHKEKIMLISEYATEVIKS